MDPLRVRIANRWRPWFRAVDALGEDTTIRWGKLAPNGELLETGFVPHERFDGVGLFTKLVREHEGVAVDAPKLRQKPPPPRRRAEVAWRVLLAPDRAPLPWKSVTLRASATPTDAFAYALLTPQEADVLFGGPDRVRMTLSSSVLHALQEAVVPDLVHRADAYVWLVPVNMRGAVAAPSDAEGNQIGFLPVGMRHGASESEIAKSMRDGLAAGLHWGTWDAMGVRAVLGEAFVRGYTRWMIRKMKQQGGTGWLGSFSFGGVVAPPAGTTPKFGWFGVPPTSLMWPISAGAFAWGRRMSLALQVHPSLGKDRAWAESAVREWKERALQAAARK